MTRSQKGSSSSLCLFDEEEQKRAHQGDEKLSHDSASEGADERKHGCYGPSVPSLSWAGRECAVLP
jgi:hypothetical protein